MNAHEFLPFSKKYAKNAKAFVAFSHFSEKSAAMIDSGTIVSVESGGMAFRSVLATVSNLPVATQEVLANAVATKVVREWGQASRWTSGLAMLLLSGAFADYVAPVTLLLERINAEQKAYSDENVRLTIAADERAGKEAEDRTVLNRRVFGGIVIGGGGGSAIGGGIGAALGILGGPPGIAIGAGLGALIGGGAGGGIAHATAAKK
jgi:hypothetical protein